MTACAGGILGKFVYHGFSDADAAPLSPVESATVVQTSQRAAGRESDLAPLAKESIARSLVLGNYGLVLADATRDYAPDPGSNGPEPPAEPAPATRPAPSVSDFEPAPPPDISGIKVFGNAEAWVLAREPATARLDPDQLAAALVRSPTTLPAPAASDPAISAEQLRASASRVLARPVARIWRNRKDGRYVWVVPDAPDAPEGEPPRERR
jgi:hypothetical protein